MNALLTQTDLVKLSMPQWASLDKKQTAKVFSRAWFPCRLINFVGVHLHPPKNQLKKQRERRSDTKNSASFDEENKKTEKLKL